MSETGNLTDTQQIPLKTLSGKTSLLPSWFVWLSNPRRILWLAPLIGFLLSAPSFFAGYMADDHTLRQYGVEDSPYHTRADWDRFNFVSNDSEVATYREQGIFLSWWSTDSFRFRYFRPIASLMHAFFFRHLDRMPWVMHVFTALLYSVLIFLCAHIFRRFSASPEAFGIAVLLFAIDDLHAYNAGWISAWNTMLCSVFGAAALLMHDTWRKKKSLPALLVSVSSFLAALLSSEGGLALWGYLFAYTVFMEKGSWTTRSVALAPGTIIAIGYLYFYMKNGLGVSGSGIYPSLSGDPLGTIAVLMRNTPVLLLGQLLSFPPLSMTLSGAGAAGAVIALILVAVLVVPFRKFFTVNRPVQFFGAGMLISVIPFAMAGTAQERLLLWAGIGAAGLLGELFTGVPEILNGGFRKPVLRTLMVTNIVVSLLFFIPTLFAAGLLFEFTPRAIERTVPSTPTVLLNAPMDVLFVYPPALRNENNGRWPDHFYTLYAGLDTVTIRRTGEKTITVSTPNGWFFRIAERGTRPQNMPFSCGDSVTLARMTAVIKETTADGRPVSVDFSFTSDISGFTWMSWSKKGPVECTLPEIGKEMKVVASLF